jgi:hypothetical protein
MEGLYFDTQESEFELVGCTRPRKTLWKDKNLRCIVDSMHVSSMLASYHHHFMFYSRDRSNVTQLILNQDWKVVYKDYKKHSPNSEFHLESLKDRL